MHGVFYRFRIAFLVAEILVGRGVFEDLVVDELGDEFASFLVEIPSQVARDRVKVGLGEELVEFSSRDGNTADQSQIVAGAVILRSMDGQGYELASCFHGRLLGAGLEDRDCHDRSIGKLRYRIFLLNGRFGAGLPQDDRHDLQIFLSFFVKGFLVAAEEKY